MKVYLATDHAGFNLKETIKEFLIEEKHFVVEDCGAHTLDKNDDYPDYIHLAAGFVADNPTDRAIIFGGSGQAEMMLANKYKGVRAALFYTPKIPPMAADVTGRVSEDPYEIIKLTRDHNDANVLSIGARFVIEEEAKKAVEIFLTTPFSEDPRHKRRLEKMADITNSL